VATTITSAHSSAGKQFVYHAIQDCKDAASLEDLANMDKETASLRDSIALSKSNEKLLKAGLAAVNATLSTEDLRVSITGLELQHTELLARLGPLRSGSVKPVLPEDKEETEKTWRQWSRKAVSRKRICTDMWSYATEELPEGQTKQELWVSADCCSWGLQSGISDTDRSPL
jgi:26S proteasome regulatory subunit (ATPase 3-interacting protein)